MNLANKRSGMKKRQSWSYLIIAVGIIIFLLLAGTAFFHLSERWSWVDSFYFTSVTITTVGYGDLTPTHNISKIVTALFGLISIPVTVFAFGVIAENYLENRMGRLEERMKELLVREEEIEDIIEDAESESTSNKSGLFKKLLSRR